MMQVDEGIMVDQDHYVKDLEMPDMDVVKDVGNVKLWTFMDKENFAHVLANCWPSLIKVDQMYVLRLNA